MRKILIIGASSSIGQEIIKEFLSNDDQVLASYNTNKIKFTGLGKSNLHTLKLDINCSDSQKLFLNSIKNIGKIDVAIFLPALLLGKSMKDYIDDEIKEVIDTNFSSQISLFQKLMRVFSKNASVIFMSSISGQRGSYDPVYAASKAAQIGFIKSIALWEGSRIRINGIAPSLVDNSSMFDAMATKRQKYHTSQSPTGKLTSKKEIAKIVFDISGKSWSNVNGQIISVNGGIL
ncbi:SDR family oxidoreductase [bacterium]|jgi:3-oxoacyl-[acyl-carrier protein] reductase|nr:SDR family oxidoreductase [bacterium]